MFSVHINFNKRPSKHAGSDSKASRLWPVMATRASVVVVVIVAVVDRFYITLFSALEHVTRVGSKCIFYLLLLIRLPASNSVPFFPKKAQIVLCTTDPDPVRFWAHESGPEVSRCARITGPVSFTTQLARYQWPTFTIGYVFPQTARIIGRQVGSVA